MIYKIIDWPIPPKDIIDAVLSTESINDRLCKIKNEKEYQMPDDLARWVAIDAPTIVKDWVKNNIPIECYVALQFFSGGTHFPPHVDSGRDEVYNFIIHTGGKNAKTCFWKPKVDADIEIKTWEWFDRSKLDLVESIQLDEHQWCYIDVSKIHSLENLDPCMKRIAISLSPISTYPPISEAYRKKLLTTVF